MRTVTRIAVIGAALLWGGLWVFAQDRPAGQEPKEAGRILELERQVKELQAAVTELSRQNVAPQQQTRLLLDANPGAKNEPKKEEPKKEERKQDIPIKMSFKDGLRFKSEDGNFEAHLGGRYQGNYRVVEDFADSISGPTDTFPRRTGFYTRAARLEIDGTVYKDWEFKVQGDWGLGTSVLQDGFVGFKRWKEFSLRLGQFKEPFSMEQLNTLLFLPMAERTTGDRLVPARDLGVMAHGKLLNDIVGYQIAYFNGDGANRTALGDVEQEKDFAVRLEVWPLKTTDFALKDMRLGAAATFGNHDDAALGDIRTRQTETRVIDMDGTTVLDGGRNRVGVEFQLPFESFGLEAEWYRVGMDLREGAVSEEIDFTQWYATLAWMVTGEKMKFGQRVRPAKNFLDKGGLGAIQLALRYGRFTADGDLMSSGFTVPKTATLNTTTRRVDEWSFAANWYPNPNTRVTLNLIRNEYGDALVGGGHSVDGEYAAIMRFQLDF